MCDSRLCACPSKKPAGKKSAGKERLENIRNDYEKFMKTEGKSLLKKYLTKEVFDVLQTRVTSHGSGLKDVVQSGFANPDSSIGLYAPDPESYDVFAELFDPVIEEYHHGFAKDAVHPDVDWGNIDDLGNVDPEGRYVLSTRIRCARSVQGYPFNPSMNEAHYREIEDKVRAAISFLEGDLKGTYYTLDSMDYETRQQLIDDHYLFKEGDRFLIAANASRYWPTGRGIFFNNDKTFIIWCNEEDHMRLISMEKSSNLGSVCSRLTRVIQQIEKHIAFTRHPRLGYLTFCPTNLGTTIRASVHIRVPNLSKNFEKFQEIADRYKLQIRGSRGEHSKSEDSVYDVSNKRRLGLTEREALLEMRNGVVELIKQEKHFEGERI
ncbi:hypothetical protein KPH14_001659 [Odynerus spinipes]|uniref:arginine kinase n=1 Tax=Odynerus spinipes TaxID=1348599 RepID=A0AAD9RZF1_9HYME|nr:hypothetical protein KPH14_001659 [Odynerus spinipes]